MHRLRACATVLLAAWLALPPAPLVAGTRKGDKLRNQARTAELKGDFDKAVTLAEQALAEDPGDPAYNLEVRRVRFEAGYTHLKAGKQLRDGGHLNEALAEFEKSLSYDPASDIARQEIQRTKEMIERNKNAPASANAPPPRAQITQEDEKTLTPVELEKKRVRQRVDSLLPVPELRPLNNDLIDLKMTNKPRVLFETVCKVAGINVLFDPDYNSQQANAQPVQIDLSRTTIEQALDELAIITKSFWKPLSANTIFVTLDTQPKRREYEEEVVKVFYLSNATTPQELQEIQTAIRTLFNVTHIMAYSAQSAIIVRAPADTMLLVEKIVGEVDKPRPEVMVDVMVMEVSSTYMRNLSTAFAGTGINTSAIFAPRPGITTPGVQSSSSSSSTSSSSTTGTSTTGTTTPTTTTGTTTTGSTGVTSVPFSALGHISSADYSVTTLPGATFEAVLNDSSTRVLQAPQIRAADSTKATLNIGSKVPTASGSFQPGIGLAGAGVSPLVNTQFTYLDVGVNVEITPHIHDNNEISMHAAIDVSQVATEVPIGGINIPEIAQNKIATDVRLHEGEVNLISGIIQSTDSRAITGIPGLANLPLIGRLFNSENKEKDRTELVIALIPHIVRSPSVSPEDLQPVASGNENAIKVSMAPRAPQPGQPAPQGVVAPPAAATPPATAPAPPAPPATAPPAPVGPPVPGGPARVSFLPGTVDTQLNSAVTVTLYGQNVNDLASAAAHLQFDPKILRVTNIVAGDLAQRNSAQLQPSKNILNEVGSADFSVSRGPNTPGISGSGGLFSIVFQAVGKGSTSVSVSNVALSSSTGGQIASNTPTPLTVNVK